MSKYYAVKNGLVPGIYNNWDDAKKQVINFKGAVYKSFKTMEEAEQFMTLGKEVYDFITIKKEIDLLIYTDGSCINKIGGYGIVLIDNPNQDVRKNTHKEEYGKVPYDPCTNQISELYAIYIALTLINNKNLNILLKTDSMYAINVLTKYIYVWEKNGYKTTENKPVKNKDLILLTFNLLKEFNNLTFLNVKAHNNEYYNEIVDKLAKKGTFI